MKKTARLIVCVILAVCLVLSVTLLVGCKGLDGKDGLNGTNGVDGKDGKDGVNGKDGITPHIGEDGYWYFGDKKTEYKATGSNGSDGKDGIDGQDGAPGKDGTDGKDGSDGKDGVNGVDGKDGKDGKDGSKIYPGNSEPSDDLGVDGDFYWRAYTGFERTGYTVYYKENGSWVTFFDASKAIVSAGSGIDDQTEVTEFIISDEADLDAFEVLVNEDATTFENKTVLLANDILITDTESWQEIATTFAGTFDGQGHTIRNFAEPSAFRLMSVAADSVGYPKIFSDASAVKLKNVTILEARYTLDFLYTGKFGENELSSDDDEAYCEIKSLDGFMAFAATVNGDADLLPESAKGQQVLSASNYLGLPQYLYSDLDLSGIDWVPLGTAEVPYAGSLIGSEMEGENRVNKVRTISGLTFNNPAEEGYKYGGLFGIICGSDDAAAPQEISYIDLEVNITDNAADSRMGAVAGQAYGNVLIQNVTVSGSIFSNKIASGFIGDAKYEDGTVKRASNLITMKDCTNLANITAPKGVGFAANVNTVSLTLENCQNGEQKDGDKGNITIPEGTTNDVVIGGFTGYIQGKNEVLNFTDCTNYGNITINITAHISKFSVGGISGGGRSTHNYTNVVNYGKIVVTDNESVESVSTENIVGEIGGFIGSASGTHTYNHVENYGNITVTTINQRNYGVGGLVGQGNGSISITSDEENRSTITCNVEVTNTANVKAEQYRVVGAVIGYDANANTKIENIDITVMLNPVSALNFGLTGSGAEFTHTESTYSNIKNVTYILRQINEETGEVGYRRTYTWNDEGVLTVGSEKDGIFNNDGGIYYFKVASVLDTVQG